MKKQSFPLILVILALVFSSLACSLGKKSDEAPMKSSDVLGEEYRSEEGGFVIRKVSNYSFDDVIGIVNMTAPDGTVDSGPGIMVLGAILDQEFTNEDLLENISLQSSGMEVGKGKSKKVDGVDGLLADISGDNNGTAVKGQVYTAMVSPTQEFVLLGIAPEERWKELEPIFKEVLDSVTFFEAKPYDPEAVESQEELEPMVVAQETAVAEPELLRQWAVEAYASSEYSTPGWGAQQATGAPNVEECEDDVFAWASLDPDTEEYIELVYETPVSPTEINIYQSYNPSTVVEVQIVDLEGQAWVAWTGEPKEVANCPDLMTITIELDEPLYIDRVVVFIDQSVMGWGWTEIDAVELVGYPQGTDIPAQPVAQQTDVPSQPQTQPTLAPTQPASSVGGDVKVPTNYSGWMAGPVYQGYLKVKVYETRVEELDKLMTIPGTKSTDSWKPIPEHMDSYIYDTGVDGMKISIKVRTDGVVYWKTFYANNYPKDYKLATVTRANYEVLDGLYKKDKVIPYAVMANLLESPGFLFEAKFHEDGKTVREQFQWYSNDGYIMSGLFLDGKLTGMAGLVYRKLD